MSRSLSKGLVAAELKMQTLHDIAAEFKEVVIQKKRPFLSPLLLLYMAQQGQNLYGVFFNRSFNSLL